MTTIVLIACVRQKLSHPARAQDLYISPLFRKNLAYARSLRPDRIFILSAKYGLVAPDQVIEPYDLTLNTMRSAEVRAWAERVLAQLGRVADLQGDHFVFLAGKKYRMYLLPHLASYEVPMEGLGIGQQLRFLTVHAPHG